MIPVQQKEAVGFVFVHGWPCMQAVFWKVSIWCSGKFSEATLVLDSWYDVLGKVFKSYNARMTYQWNCFSSLQAGICIPPRLVDYNFAISVP
jgi:hypothetical protein